MGNKFPPAINSKSSWSAVDNPGNVPFHHHLSKLRSYTYIKLSRDLTAIQRSNWGLNRFSHCKFIHPIKLLLTVLSHIKKLSLLISFSSDLYQCHLDFLIVKELFVGVMVVNAKFNVEHQCDRVALEEWVEMEWIRVLFWGYPYP